ncbi:MAG: leucine--tRNA ligase [Bacteroidota bacterium]
MADYDFKTIEATWQQYWARHATFRTQEDTTKPKYYVLDMFPYPSGAGLHVGHPLGYIASDVVARHKRSQGYNVLHPMGFDAFGLPAEQYALQTGQHPAKTTTENSARYREQLQRIGLSFDWERTVYTSDPAYYRWTQWIFLQLFQSWYDTVLQKARPVTALVTHLEQKGNKDLQAACDEDTPTITAETWQQMTEQEQQALLLKYRLAFLEATMVNWCPELGTVLANEEVKDGVSERGSHPVVRQKMQQWSLRMTAYADRLLADLEALDWPASVKEMQRNWIGKSTGASVSFLATSPKDISYALEVFTTRPDTIFGVTYLALAPEHPHVKALTTPEQQTVVAEYIEQAQKRSERERQADVKRVTGVFTGTYTKHPLTGEPLPIWVADYVLVGYGTGAVMGVPAHDRRDHAFARHFALPIIPVIRSKQEDEMPYEAKEGTLINSDFLDGLSVQEATERVLAQLEAQQLGRRKTTFRLRSAIFSRQRYWGEPFPIFYKDGIPYALPENELPLELPPVKAYHPTATGRPPLGHAENWQTAEGHPLELSTMPGWAGSSWYLLRYMDPHNKQALVSPEAEGYWKGVDLYIGGAEHATGHLLYARFWMKFLHDLGHVSTQEPFQKLINQGMIQGQSCFVYRIKGTQQFVSHGLRQQYDTVPMHVSVDLVKDSLLNTEAFRQWRPELQGATFILEDGQYRCGTEVEKMSKSKHNVVNPDTIIDQYGADTLRLYTLFLGPLEQSKPWDTHGIEGVSRFLHKLWRLFHPAEGLTTATPPAAAMKILHQTIKKVDDAIARYALNTAVSAFMVCVNELTALPCRHRAVLQDLVVLLAPFAPYIAEALWQHLGHDTSVAQATWPTLDTRYLQEATFEYPITVNGKVRTRLSFALETPNKEIERQVLADETVQKWMQNKPLKKIIIVPQRIVNVVV